MYCMHARAHTGGDHAGFWETSAILGCCEPAAKLSELERPDTPWFADLAYKKANGQVSQHHVDKSAPIVLTPTLTLLSQSQPSIIH